MAGDIRTWRAVVENHLGFSLRLTDEELLGIMAVKRNAYDAAEYIKLLMKSALYGALDDNQ